MITGTYRYGNTRVVHFGISDGQGNTWPACGQRVGRYSLPMPAGPEVTCRKCQAL